MDKKNEIIEFEDLFKQEIDKRKQDKTPETRKGYGSVIIVYLLIMFIFSSLLYFIMQEITSFQQTYSETELILENVTADSSGLALMNQLEYELYQDTYEDYVIVVGTIEGYVILVNYMNTDYDALFLEFDPLENVDVLNEAAVRQAFGEIPVILNWTTGNPIQIYAGATQVLPVFVDIEANIVTGPVTELSNFGSSLLNFLTYLALFPIIILLLKSEIIYDFQEFKTRKNEWFLIIIVGYLYLILGNVLSGYLSQILGGALGLPPEEAVNQLTIVRALQGSGAIFMFLSAVIMGPIIEELVFRKSMFGLIKNDKIAIAVSAIIFGSIHLIGEASILAALVNGISYFVMGFVFGYIYIKNHKNIMAPIAVHILSNLISILAILFLF